VDPRVATDGITRYDAADSLKFFDDVAPLLKEMTRTMGVALDLGHAAICIVTPATRKLLEAQLREMGIDVEAVRERGQYVHLDAAATLERILCEGTGPDAGRFGSTIGGLVDRLAAAYAGVWMFGELAGLLWVRGDQAGALTLEKMWLKFADTHPVCLCVAFPLEALSYPIVVEAIQKVVAEQIRTLANNSLLGLSIRRGPARVERGPERDPERVPERRSPGRFPEWGSEQDPP
jgi:hypothetical protein